MSASHKIEGLLGLDTSNRRKSGSEGQLPGRWNACTVSVCLRVHLCVVTNQALTANWNSGHSPSLADQEGNSHESQHPHDLCQYHFYTSISFCLYHPYTLFCTLQMPCRTVPRRQILLQLQWIGTQGVQKTTGCATGRHWEPRGWEDCLVHVPVFYETGQQLHLWVLLQPGTQAKVHQLKSMHVSKF